MTDEIKTLTARLAEEPSSLAFLELGEALRRRGQLEAAYKVARGGLARYPTLADAHDLMARILGDQGDLAGAFDAWAEALPETVSLTIGGLRIHMIHDRKALQADPSAEGWDVVISGHSHKPGIEETGATLWLNPGAAGPRAARGTDAALGAALRPAAAGV